MGLMPISISRGGSRVPNSIPYRAGVVAAYDAK